MSRCGIGLCVLLWLLLCGFDWPGRRAASEPEARTAGQRAAQVRRLSIGPAREVEARLRRALDDPSPPVRSAAVRALAKLRVREALPELAARLEDASPEVRAAAARALGTLDAVALGPVLARSLGDADASVRVASLEALAQLDATSALPEVLALLDDPDTLVRAHAARALASLGDATASAALSRKAADPVPEVRAEVLRTLAALSGPAGMHVYVRSLQDPAESVVLAALQAVGQAGADGAVRALSSHLDDPRDRVARQAYAALALRPTKRAAALLLARAGERRFADLAPAALQRAVSQQPSLREPLARELARALAFSDGARQAEGWVRLATATRLPPHSAPLRLALLRELRQRRVPSAEVLAALAGVTETEVCAQVFALDPGAPDADAAVLLDAAAPCVHADGGLWVEPLADWLEQMPSPGTRASVVRLLGQTASPRAANVVAPALGSPHPAVRRAALAALARVGDDSRAPLVWTHLQQEPDAAVRAEAVLTYGELAPPDALVQLLALADERSPPATTWQAVAAALEAGRKPDGSRQQANALEAALRRALLQGASEPTAQHALDAAVAWGTPPALEAVLAIGREHGRLRRRAAARALARMADARARAALRKLTEDADAEVAATALLALTPTLQADDAGWLSERALNGSWPASPVAAFLLARLELAGALPGELQPRLCALANSAEPHTSANGLAALSAREATDCASMTIERARSLNDVRGRSARRAAGEQGGGLGAPNAPAPAPPWLAVQYRDGSVALVSPDALGRIHAPDGTIWVTESAYRARFLRQRD